MASQLFLPAIVIFLIAYGLIISEKFNKYYSNFEEFQKEVWKNIEVALNEIDSGKAITMEKALAELEAKNETN